MAFIKFPITAECKLLLIVAWVVHVVTLATLGLRFIVRILKRLGLGWDDFLIAFAAMCTTGIVSLFSICKWSFFAKHNTLYLSHSIIATTSGLGYSIKETILNYEFNGKVGDCSSNINCYGSLT